MGAATMPAIQGVHLLGLAAVLGGVLWVIKAGAIMVTGFQPPLIFELGQLFFTIGLVGLYDRLEGRAGSLGWAGLFLVLIAIASLTGLAGYSLWPGAELPAEEAFVFPVSLFYLCAAAGTFGGLILLGVAAWRAGSISRSRRTLPLAVGLLPVPAAISGLLHEELPILLLGVGWMLLGYLIWSEN